ncbi:hypothetical protein NIB75_14560 [Bacteroides uniformis]|nr:hypothetical protein [Bacteroides uniformis]
MVGRTARRTETGILALPRQTVGRGGPAFTKQYPQLLPPKKEGLLSEDDRSMLSEIVSELADAELCRANGRTLEDMCDTDGAFLEEYQEQFNRIYDELEMRITDYMNGQSKNM